MLLDKLCHEAGVEVRFFTRVIDADADPQQGRVHGVITNSVEGYRYIAPRPSSTPRATPCWRICAGRSRGPPAATRPTSCRPRSAP